MELDTGKLTVDVDPIVTWFCPTEITDVSKFKLELTTFWPSSIPVVSIL